MGMIKEEEIVGYLIDEMIVCRKCATREENMNATGDDIILSNELDESLYYCDRCKARIKEI